MRVYGKGMFIVGDEVIFLLLLPLSTNSTLSLSILFAKNIQAYRVYCCCCCSGLLYTHVYGDGMFIVIVAVFLLLLLLMMLFMVLNWLNLNQNHGFEGFWENRIGGPFSFARIWSGFVGVFVTRLARNFHAHADEIRFCFCFRSPVRTGQTTRTPKTCSH
jgi:hypothetical protein